MASDDELYRSMAAEEEGIPELEGQPPGKVLTGDTGEDLPLPRDYPIGAEEYGTTPAEEAQGETLAQRVEREEPELVPSESTDPLQEDDYVPAGRLLQPDAGMLDVDDTAEEAGDATGEIVGLRAGLPRREQGLRAPTGPADRASGRILMICP
jgi:hypothetical protein